MIFFVTRYIYFFGKTIRILYLEKDISSIKKKIMTLVIKKDTDKIVIQQLLKKISRKSKFDIEKYCGLLNLTKSPLILQKEWRNEWE